MATPARRAFLAVLIAPFLLAACRSEPADAQVDAADGDTYVVAFLVRGASAAERTREERQSIQAAHMANINKLAHEGKLVIAGPFGQIGDGTLRGIFVFDTPDVKKAREWTDSDPAVQAKVLDMELAVLRTETPLRKALELYRAQVTADEANGKKVNEGDRMRSYGMLFARDAAQARGALARSRESGKIVFEGELTGSPRAKLLAVIDAQNAEEARTVIGALESGLGDHDLVTWYAAKAIAELPRPAL